MENLSCKEKNVELQKKIHSLNIPVIKDSLNITQL